METGYVDVYSENYLESYDDTYNPYPGYKLIEELGSGYTGVVWKAQRLKDGKIVAIKLITIPNDQTRQTFVNRLLDEIEILKSISRPCHPNLACFNSYTLYDNVLLIDMDLVNGIDLHRYVETVENKETLYRHLLAITKDLVPALKYLHQVGIIHKDIKPDNIMIDEDLFPVLVDFGVSCKVEDICRLDSTEINCCDSVRGPVNYMAPEIMKYRHSFPQSDVWSLGVTLYIMATGQYPWNLSWVSDAKRLQIIASQEPAKLKTSNEILNTIVNGALMKDPLDRITLAEIEKLLN